MIPEQGPQEKGPKSSELSSSDIEQLNRQIDSKLEMAGQEAEHQSQRIESAQAEVLRHSETDIPRQEAEAAPRKISGRERMAHYRETMNSLQRRLSPAGRKFSQFIHAPTIERASEALEKTVMRPSVTMGASVTALIIGGLFYFTARHYGFALSGSEFVLSVIVGGILGLVIELIWKLFTRRK
jgi:hypothetical protein